MKLANVFMHHEGVMSGVMVIGVTSSALWPIQKKGYKLEPKDTLGPLFISDISKCSDTKPRPSLCYSTSSVPSAKRSIPSLKMSSTIHFSAVVFLRDAIFIPLMMPYPSYIHYLDFCPAITGRQWLNELQMEEERDINHLFLVPRGIIIMHLTALP